MLAIYFSHLTQAAYEMISLPQINLRYCCYKLFILLHLFSSQHAKFKFYISLQMDIMQSQHYANTPVGGQGLENSFSISNEKMSYTVRVEAGSAITNNLVSQMGGFPPWGNSLILR